MITARWTAAALVVLLPTSVPRLEAAVPTVWVEDVPGVEAFATVDSPYRMLVNGDDLVTTSFSQRSLTVYSRDTGRVRRRFVLLKSGRDAELVEDDGRLRFDEDQLTPPDEMILAGGRLFVATSFTDSMHVLDAETYDPIALLPIPRGGGHFAATSDGAFVYFVGRREERIHEIDTRSLELRSIDFPREAYRGAAAAVTPDDRRLLVSMVSRPPAVEHRTPAGLMPIRRRLLAVYDRDERRFTRTVRYGGVGEKATEHAHASVILQPPDGPAHVAFWQSKHAFRTVDLERMRWNHDVDFPGPHDPDSSREWPNVLSAARHGSTLFALGRVGRVHVYDADRRELRAILDVGGPSLGGTGRCCVVGDQLYVSQPRRGRIFGIRLPAFDQLVDELVEAGAASSREFFAPPIAQGSPARRVRLEDVPDVEVFETPDRAENFLVNGDHLVVTSFHDSTMNVLDLKSKRLLHRFIAVKSGDEAEFVEVDATTTFERDRWAHPSRLTLANGRLFVEVSFSKSVYVFDAKSYDPLALLPFEGGGRFVVAADERTLFYANNHERRFYVVDTESLRWRSIDYPEGGRGIGAIALSPDGNRLHLGIQRGSRRPGDTSERGGGTFLATYVLREERYVGTVDLSGDRIRTKDDSIPSVIIPAPNGLLHFGVWQSPHAFRVVDPRTMTWDHDVDFPGPHDPKHQPEWPGVASAALVGDVLVTVCRGGRLHLYDTRRRELRGILEVGPFDGQGSGRILVHGGHLYVGHPPKKRVYAIPLEQIEAIVAGKFWPPGRTPAAHHVAANSYTPDPIRPPPDHPIRAPRPNRVLRRYIRDLVVFLRNPRLDLEWRVRMDREKFVVGEPITATMSLRNQNRRDRPEITWGYSLESPSIATWGQPVPAGGIPTSGERAGEWERLVERVRPRPIETTQVNVPAGRTVSQQLILSEDGHEFEPGRYRIYLRLEGLLRMHETIGNAPLPESGGSVKADFTNEPHVLGPLEFEVAPRPQD